LTPKEQGFVMHSAKQFMNEGNFILWVWLGGQTLIVLHLKQDESLVQMFMKS
jgi:hypothetical protein